MHGKLTWSICSFVATVQNVVACDHDICSLPVSLLCHQGDGLAQLAEPYKTINASMFYTSVRKLGTFFAILCKMTAL